MSYEPAQKVFQDLDVNTPYPLIHPEQGKQKPRAAKAKPNIRPGKTPRSIAVCDVYAGTGGMGYMDTEMTVKGETLKLETKWAVDFDASAVASWKHNRPEVHAYHMSVDDFLFLCKKWDDLSTRYENWVPEDEEDEDDIEIEMPAPALDPVAEDENDADDIDGRNRARRAVKSIDRLEIDGDKGRYEAWLAGAKGRQAAEKLAAKQKVATASLTKALKLADANKHKHQQREKQGDDAEVVAALQEAVKLGTGAQLKTAQLSRARELLQTMGAHAHTSLAAADEDEDVSIDALMKKIAVAEGEAAAAAEAMKEEKKQLAAAVAACVDEAHDAVADGDGKYIPADSFDGIKQGFAFRTGDHGPGYYRDTTEEKAMNETVAKAVDGKKQEWGWTRDVTYTVSMDDVPVYNKKPEVAGQEPLLTLTLGTEFTAKKGTFTTVGDSWIKVTKASQVPGMVAHHAWIPMIAQGKTLVEEVKEEEQDGSDEEEYEIEKIVEMRVMGGAANKIELKNHPFRRGQVGKGPVFPSFFRDFQ